MVIFGFGLLANMWHDDDLREIRRAAARKQRKQEQEGKHGKGKGLEWIEWAGWWIIGGPKCVPARIFLLNEISAMFPRALQGRQWYIKKFGKEAVGNKKAIIPGLL